MDRDNRDIEPLAVTCQDVVDGGVEYSLFRHKNRLIFRKSLHQLGKLDDCLPVNLNLPNRGCVFRRQESSLAFVVPGLADGECLVREVKVFGCNCQCLGKAHPSFGNQQNQPVPVDVTAQIQVDEQRVEFKLI